MPTLRILTLRVAIAALIWGSALLAPAAAEQMAQNPGEPENVVASIERPTLVNPPANTLGAPPAGQTSYRYATPDAGPPTPGPTDPNGPSS